MVDQATAEASFFGKEFHVQDAVLFFELTLYRF